MIVKLPCLTHWRMGFSEVNLYLVKPVMPFDMGILFGKSNPVFLYLSWVDSRSVCLWTSVSLEFTNSNSSSAFPWRKDPTSDHIRGPGICVRKMEGDRAPLVRLWQSMINTGPHSLAQGGSQSGSLGDTVGITRGPDFFCVCENRWILSSAPEAIQGSAL